MGMNSGRTRVLVVEDEQDIAGLIKHALEREGAMEVDVAGSGDAALKSVTEDPPDLVILDLNLPVLSGVEVCRIMRGRAETAKVSIIMLTARSGREQESSAVARSSARTRVGLRPDHRDAVSGRARRTSAREASQASFQPLSSSSAASSANAARARSTRCQSR